MTTFYDTLKIEQGKCPPGCAACEEACARETADGVRESAKIKAVHGDGFHGALTCIQCGEPACTAVCPTGAISRSREDGFVRVREEKCVGCGLCSVTCSYGGIYLQPGNPGDGFASLAMTGTTGNAVKCDGCAGRPIPPPQAEDLRLRSGQPACVKACEQGVLSLVRSRDVYHQFKDSGLIPQGTGQCLGCPAELGLRIAMKVFGKNTILFGAASCAAGVIVPSRVASHICLMTNIAATMEGVKTYYRQLEREVHVVAYAGDGATADAGFQNLSGAAERGENLVYICYDNEGYMNTGVQRSSTTPYKAWTTTTPLGKGRHGKEQPGKYLPLIMACHGIPYVATATLSHLDDYASKLVKARENKEGMSYIHLLAPCPTGWRYPSEAMEKICRMAVETNYFPLWELERGSFRFTYPVEHPEPINEFTRLMARFSHFNSEDIDELQKLVDDRLKAIQSLACLAK